MSGINVIREIKRMPRKIISQLKPLIQKVLIKCLNSNIVGNKLKWEEFEDIFEGIQEIQNIEKDYATSMSNRNSPSCWEEFYEWCSQYGSEFNAVKVKKLDDENYGLIAEDEIKEYQEFLTIPRKLMMSEDTANNSKLGPLIAKDPVLQHMPNIQLSLQLIIEALNMDSFWRPYISILPSSYNTILYFNIEELKELKGSLILDEVLKMYCSVARQYCYFFQLFQNDSIGRSLNIGQYFTYDLYRWAVSTVMTRQNAIPSIDGISQAALIPFFDMCNHANGKICTDFSLEKNALVSYANQHFSIGDEVRMFYGPRRNSEFFMHNGFVYPENENDAIELKLGISKSDPLFSVKSDVLAKLDFKVQEAFKMRKKDLISDKLLLFLKVNVMKPDELKNISNLDVADIHQTLHDSHDLTKRALLFLKNRMDLLLRSYKTTIEEDESVLSTDLSMNCKILHQLLNSEKYILKYFYNYCVENST